MYYRRKILLNFIAAFGEKGVDAIKLQKLLFLFCQDETVRPFNFVPYKYGCYSFQANKDLSVMAKHYGLLEETKNTWRLKSKLGQRDSAITPPHRQKISDLCQQFAKSTKAHLVDKTYAEYPYFSIHSEWAMTPTQKRNAAKERGKIAKQNNQVLFTIGYEGRDIDAYLDTLVRNNIKLLCDVRKNPLSRKYGFSKRQLAHCCENLGIEYVHLPELGIVSAQRKHLASEADYRVLFKSYAKTLTQKNDAIARVFGLLKQHNRIALTCFENAYESCHRHLISDHLVNQNRVECAHL